MWWLSAPTTWVLESHTQTDRDRDRDETETSQSQGMGIGYCETSDYSANFFFLSVTIIYWNISLKICFELITSRISECDFTWKWASPIPWLWLAGSTQLFWFKRLSFFLTNIPLCIWTTLSLHILQLMDIWALSISLPLWLLWIKLQWTCPLQ